MRTLSWPGLALAAILCGGAAVRFHQLGVPTLWFDEMWSVLVASLTPANIVDAALRLDQHPPFHNLLVKGLMQLGTDDFALRAFFAACGVASLYAVHRLLRQAHGETVALTGAFFLAFHPLHVWVSRTLRVYSLLFLLAVAAFAALAPRLAPDRARRDKTLFWANVGLCLAHYVSIVLVFAQWVVCLVARLSRPGPKPNWRELVRDALFFFVPTLAALPFLFLVLLHKNTGSSLGQDTILSKLIQTAEPLRRLAVMDAHGPLAWLCLTGLALGLLGLARRQTLAPLGRAAAWTAVFLGVIVVSRYSNIVTFAYIIPCLIPLAYLAGGLGAWMEHREKPYCLCLALAALACVPVFIRANDAALYQEDNTFTQRIFPVGNYKAIARELPRALARADFFAASDLFFFGGVNWYLDQFVRPNPLSHSFLADAPGPRTGCFVSHAAQPELLRNILPVTPADAAVTDTGPFAALCLTRDRRPALDLENTRPVWLRPRLDEALTDVAAATDATIAPQWGGAWIPARYDTPAQLAYDLRNGIGQGPTSFSLRMAYRNSSEGSTLAVSLTFDDEAEREIFRSSGPDPRQTVTITHHRDRPFARVRLIVRLQAVENRIVPGFSALDNVALQSVCLVASDTAGQAAADTRLLTQTAPVAPNLAPMTGAEAWQGDNIAVITEEDGHQAAVARDPGKPAAIRLAYESPLAGQIVYYPRVGAPGSAVLLSVEDADGSRRQLAAFAGWEKAWTPLWLAALAPLEAVPPAPGRRIVLELLGAGAQLHLRQNAVFCQSP